MSLKFLASMCSAPSYIWPKSIWSLTQRLAAWQISRHVISNYSETGKEVAWICPLQLSSRSFHTDVNTDNRIKTFAMHKRFGIVGIARGAEKRLDSRETKEL